MRRFNQALKRRPRGPAVKRVRFNDEQQVTLILKRAEEGTAVGEVCRKAGISKQNYHRQCKIYGDLLPSGMPRLKQFEEDDLRLRRPATDLSLDTPRSGFFGTGAHGTYERVAASGRCHVRTPVETATAGTARSCGLPPGAQFLTKGPRTRLPPPATAACCPAGPAPDSAAPGRTATARVASSRSCGPRVPSRKGASPPGGPERLSSPPPRQAPP